MSLRCADWSAVSVVGSSPTPSGGMAFEWDCDWTERHGRRRAQRIESGGVCFALMHEFRRAYDAWGLVPAGLAARPRRGHFFPRNARRPRHQARRILHRRAEPVPARKGRVRSPSSQRRSEQARGCGLRRLWLGQFGCTVLYRRPECAQGTDVARLLDPSPDRDAAAGIAVTSRPLRYRVETVRLPRSTEAESSGTPRAVGKAS